MIRTKKSDDASRLDLAREKDSFRIVIIGLAVVLVAFGASLWKWATASDVATAMGTITGVVGTLVGAFFGIKVGGQGKEKAQQDNVRASKEAAAFRVQLDDSTIQSTLKKLGDPGTDM